MTSMPASTSIPETPSKLPDALLVNSDPASKVDNVSVKIEQESPLALEGSPLPTVSDVLPETNNAHEEVSSSSWSLSSSDSIMSYDSLSDDVSVLSFLDCPLTTFETAPSIASFSNSAADVSSHSRSSSSWSAKLSRFTKHASKPSLSSNSSDSSFSKSGSESNALSSRGSFELEPHGIHRHVSRAKRLLSKFYSKFHHKKEDSSFDPLAPLVFAPNTSRVLRVTNEANTSAISLEKATSLSSQEQPGSEIKKELSLYDHEFDQILDLAIKAKKDGNLENAIEFLEYIMPEVASQQNFVPYELAELYKQRGTSQDLKSILPLYMLAASLGHDRSSFLVGEAFFYGTYGARENKLRALQYYHLANDKGNADAMLALCKLYLRGLPGHIFPSSRRAFEYAHRAAMLGHAPACYVLGKFYETGVGCVKDLAKSEAGFRAGLINDSPITDADALQIASTLVLLQ